MANLKIKDVGTWKDPKEVFIKDAGTWKSAQAVYVKNNGSWVKMFTSGIVEGTRLYISKNKDGGYPGSGSVFYDLSGNGYNATAVGSPIINSNHINFDGVDDYLWINTLSYGASSLRGTVSELTIGAWVRTTFNSGSVGVYNSANWSILDFDRSETFNFVVGGAGDIQFSGRSSNNGGIGGTYYDITGNGLVNDGNWHFIALTFSIANQEIRMYIDGQLDKLHTANGSMTALGNVTSSTRFGFIGDGSEATTANGSRNNIYYEGDIGEVHMYDDKVLTAAEILHNYDVTKSSYGL